MAKKRDKIGKLTKMDDAQCRNFIQTFHQSKTYQDVAAKLNQEVSRVMYIAQVMRSQGIELPYLKTFPKKGLTRVWKEV